MNRLSYLLYILSSTISSPTPKLIDNLGRWISKNVNSNLEIIDLNNFLLELELKPEQVEHFQKLWQSESMEKFNSLLHKHEIKIVNLLEPNYPKLLLQISDPPLVLYYRGNLTTTQIPIAMVGSRRHSDYGKIISKQIISGLSGTDIVIVSGLALGMDALCHQNAIETGLTTTAVLASGLDDNNLYPKNNYALAMNILKHNGALISEYPPLTKPRPYQFVARNRIIAGLCKATVIIECAEKSGALITADFAMDYNRQVFAIPASLLLSTSQGGNRLLAQGATPLLKSDDLLAHLDIQPVYLQTKGLNQFTEAQQTVIKCMQTGISSFEELLNTTKLKPEQLQTELTFLELNRTVTQTGPQIFHLIDVTTLS